MHTSLILAAQEAEEGRFLSSKPGQHNETLYPKTKKLKEVFIIEILDNVWIRQIKAEESWHSWKAWETLALQMQTLRLLCITLNPPAC